MNVYDTHKAILQYAAKHTDVEYKIGSAPHEKDVSIEIWLSGNFVGSFTRLPEQGWVYETPHVGEHVAFHPAHMRYLADMLEYIRTLDNLAETTRFRTH